MMVPFTEKENTWLVLGNRSKKFCFGHVMFEIPCREKS